MKEFKIILPNCPSLRKKIEIRSRALVSFFLDLSLLKALLLLLLLIIIIIFFFFFFFVVVFFFTPKKLNIETVKKKRDQKQSPHLFLSCKPSSSFIMCVSPFEYTTFSPLPSFVGGCQHCSSSHKCQQFLSISRTTKKQGRKRKHTTQRVELTFPSEIISFHRFLIINGSQHHQSILNNN